MGSNDLPWGTACAAPAALTLSSPLRGRGGGGGTPRAPSRFNMNPNPLYFTIVDLPTRFSNGL